MVGALRGMQGEQACRRATEIDVAAAEGIQAVADHDGCIGFFAGPEVDGAVIARAVQRQGFQCGQKCRRIAAAHFEAAHGFGRIAKGDQVDLGMAECGQPCRKCFTFAPQVAVTRAAGRIEIERDASGFFGCGQGVRAAGVDTRKEGALRRFEGIRRFQRRHITRLLGHAETQLALWRDVLAGELGTPDGVAALEVELGVGRVGGQFRGRAIERHFGLHRKLPHAVAKVQWHQVTPVRSGIVHHLLEFQRDALLAVGRNRIQTGAEYVAGGQLGQAGIDLLAGDVLKCHACGLLRNDHAFTHRAVHFQRIA